MTACAAHMKQNWCSHAPCDRVIPLYVVDLRWVNIQSTEEASKVLRVGNKNRSAAATKMNQSSSRR